MQSLYAASSSMPARPVLRMAVKTVVEVPDHKLATIVFLVVNIVTFCQSFSFLALTVFKKQLFKTFGGRASVNKLQRCKIALAESGLLKSGEILKCVCFKSGV